MSMSNRRMENRRVFLTGAASGIGRATAQRFAKEGARLYLVDVQATALDELALSLAGEGIPPITRVCDVSNEVAVNEAIADSVAQFGGLDVLCNVAAIIRFDHFHELRTEDYRKILAVNLDGTMFTCRAALPHLLQSRGNIVNVASTAAIHGQPWAAAYAASKGAVLAMTKSIAIDYARQGLRANAVLPCDITTPMYQEFRLPEGAHWKLVKRVQAPKGTGAPENVAGVIVMLASDDGAHMTGAEVRIDGGTFC